MGYINNLDFHLIAFVICIDLLVVVKLLKFGNFFWLGSGDKVFVDPEINEVIQNICKTLLAFVEDNSEAWAPIITKVCNLT